MALSDTIPTIVADSILMALEKQLVYRRFFNSDYQGEVAYGNSVKIPAIGSVDVNDYTRYAPGDPPGITWQDVSDSSQTLNIDQQKYFAVRLDDVDAIQSRPELMAPYATEAANQLADKEDQFLAETLTEDAGITSDLGTSGTPLEINSGNVKETLLSIGRKLDDAKCPREGRVVAVPPWFVEKLVLADIELNTDNSTSMSNGLVGRRFGFDILMSHNVPNDSGSAYEIIAGAPLAATVAEQINNVETLRLESMFGDGMRGLHVYGAKVTRSGILAKAVCNEADE